MKIKNNKSYNYILINIFINFKLILIFGKVLKKLFKF